LKADSGVQALRRGVLQEAEAMARREMEDARQASEQLQKKAREEAEAEAEQILRQAERESATLRRSIASSAEIEGKRRWLVVRERLIEQALDRTRGLLKESAGVKSRRRVLLRMLVEAVREAGGGQVSFQTAEADQGLVTTGFLDEARDLLGREGISAELHPMGSLGGITGGVIVRADGGRLVVDNSLEARMERQEAALRDGIWHILSGSWESGGA
jgi:vacuolar-type H+-ATPase subunit E/Vma4